MTVNGLNIRLIASTLMSRTFGRGGHSRSDPRGLAEGRLLAIVFDRRLSPLRRLSMIALLHHPQAFLRAGRYVAGARSYRQDRRHSPRSWRLFTTTDDAGSAFPLCTVMVRGHACWIPNPCRQSAAEWLQTAEEADIQKLLKPIVKSVFAKHVLPRRCRA